jgi:apolipoprotein N-acyltransferase
MKNKVSGIWHQPWLLAIIAGILLGLSFPPFDLPLLQFPAFILLFRVTELSNSWREMVIKLTASFIIWNLMTTYWLMMATLTGGMSAILANALLMLIPFVIIRSLLKFNLHLLTKAILVASAWGSYEFFHHQWELAWPWLSLGNAWPVLPDLIQYISITGSLGVSFWVVATSVLFYRALETLNGIHFTYAILFFLTFPLFSIISKVVYQEQSAEALHAAIIQPDLNSYLDYGGFRNTDQLLTHLLGLSDSVRTDNTDVIIWPENAIDSAIPRENRFNARIADSLNVWDTELITGAGFIDFYNTGEKPPVFRRNHDGAAYNFYNSAMHYSGDPVPDIYRKGRLVPIVERIPYAPQLQKLDIFGWLNLEENLGYGNGTETNNFITNGYQTPALICYDSVFPGWVRGFVLNGADYLTIITNDGWWGDTSGHVQHFEYARLRAIEFRKWVVRSANNGISGVISPDGKVQLRTEYQKQTGFTFRIYPDDRLTFFARYGNWFNWLMAAGLFLGILFISIRKNESVTSVETGKAGD